VGEPVRLVVHGHFYQPPRENPWTEEVPVEPSAAPFHDWNERITAECYRPNGWARVVDEHGRVAGVVDNYEHLSFDLGPTLASWLERHHPDVLARMVEGDAVGGGAFAQAYNHIILPLADDLDVRTQVRWGLADFAHRFGRATDAMWLPEAAVDERVLRLLAEEGVRATVLAPGQAATPIVEGVPHRWRHPERADLCVDLVFYDGPLSHELAFALTGLSSHELVDRVRQAGDEGVPVVVAADGETFGHHHRWADRSLAYAFAHEAPERDVRVLSLPALLAEVPAVEGVEVRRSSWSCAHGVERWRSDCGCQTGGEPWWSQAWREPLRRALDLVRDHGRGVFERRGAAVFADPWAGRDGYIDVLLGTVTPGDFVARHAREGAAVDAVEALTLLELQRQSMLMYTSCGWFFNDLAGLETVQVLRYAARAIDLIEELGESAPLDEFLAVLGEARSNRPEEGTGADIWRTHVEPSRVDAGRVVAHLALLDLLEQQEGGPHIGGHEVVQHDRRRLRRGGYGGVSGRVELAHRRTGRRTTHVYAAVRLGGLEVAGAVRPADDERDDEAFARLADVAEHTDRVTAVLRVIVDAFGPREFGLEAALPEAAGAIVASTADALADRFAGAFARMWEDNRALLGALAMAGHPLAPELRMPIGFALARSVQAAMGVVAGETAGDVEVALAAVSEAAEAATEARRLRVTGASDHGVAAAVGQALLAATRRAVADPAHVDVVLALVRLRRALDVGVDVDRAQELVVDARDGAEHVERLAAALGVAGGGR
jgi:alpha-amylase/alpha-mannosidase (GH57 family)